MTAILKIVACVALLCVAAGCGDESHSAVPATTTDEVGNGLPPQYVLDEIESAVTSDAKWHVLYGYYSSDIRAHPVIPYDVPTELRWNWSVDVTHLVRGKGNGVRFSTPVAVTRYRFSMRMPPRRSGP